MTFIQALQYNIYHFDWKYIPARTGINFPILPACELNPAPENYTRLYLTHTEMQQKQHKTAKLNIPTHFHIDKGLCVMYLSLLRARLLLPWHRVTCLHFSLSLLCTLSRIHWNVSGSLYFAPVLTLILFCDVFGDQLLYVLRGQSFVSQLIEHF